jgi:hypothetical protein
MSTWGAINPVADFPTSADEAAGNVGRAAQTETDESDEDMKAPAPAAAVVAMKPARVRARASSTLTKTPRLADMPAAFFAELDGKWLSSYDLGAVYPATALTPTATAVLAVHAAAVYDAAVAAGMRPLGIAPANCRGGKYAHALPGNPPRIYAGMAKLPHQPATKFSIL